MLTLIWYIFSGKEQEIVRDIARGSTKAMWQRHLIYLTFLIDAVVEFTTVVMLAKALFL